MATILKRKKIYYVYWSEGGKRKAKAISPSKKQAEEFKNILEMQLRAKKHNLIIPKITIKQVFKEFIDVNQNLKRNKTLKYYNTAYDNFETWNRNHYRIKFIEEFNQTIFNKFLNYKIKSKLSDNTINKYIIFFKMILKYSYSMKYLVNIDFLENIKLMKITKSSDDYIATDRDIKILLENVKHPYKTAILLATFLGLRRGEVCHLTFDDIDFEKNCIFIKEKDDWQPKNKTSVRKIYLNKDLKEYLLNIKKLSQNKTNYVLFYPEDFTHISEDVLTSMMLKFKRKFNIDERFHFHSLRHYAITKMATGGAPIFMVSKFVGHKNSRITEEIYTHLHNDNYESFLKKYNDDITNKFLK